MASPPVLPVRPFAAREKVKLILWFGFVAAVAIAVGWFFITQSDPRWTFFIWVGWLGVALGVIWLVLLAKALVTPHFPTLETIERDGETLTGVRTWRLPWALQWVQEGVFALVGLTAPVFDVLAGGENLVVSVPAGLYGVWQAVGLGLYVLGAKRREALWIGGGRLIRDSRWGVASIPLEEITRLSSSSLGGESLIVETSRPPAWRLSPRLWRRAVRIEPRVVVATKEMGHSAEDLERWVGSHLSESRGQQR